MENKPMQLLFNLFDDLFVKSNESGLFFIDSLKGILTPNELNVGYSGTPGFDLMYNFYPGVAGIGMSGMSIGIFKEMSIGISYLSYMDEEDELEDITIRGMLTLGQGTDLDADLSTIIPDEVALLFFRHGIEIEYPVYTYSAVDLEMGNLVLPDGVNYFRYDKESIIRRQTIKEIIDGV